jgi:hypothetical protein
MEILKDPSVNQIVVIERNDHDGDRIPMEYRHYVGEKTYRYKAKIIRILENRRYNRVQPLPYISPDTNSARMFTRKGYKSKIYSDYAFV